MEDES